MSAGQQGTPGDSRQTAWGSGGSLKGYVQAENRMTGPGAPTEAAPADAALARGPGLTDSSGQLGRSQAAPGTAAVPESPRTDLNTHPVPAPGPSRPARCRVRLLGVLGTSVCVRRSVGEGSMCQRSGNILSMLN